VSYDTEVKSPIVSFILFLLPYNKTVDVQIPLSSPIIKTIAWNKIENAIHVWPEYNWNQIL